MSFRNTNKSAFLINCHRIEEVGEIVYLASITTIEDSFIAVPINGITTDSQSFGKFRNLQHYAKFLTARSYINILGSKK